jgi:hypothetical protein
MTADSLGSDPTFEPVFNPNPKGNDADLLAIVDLIQKVANNYQGDTTKLLQLLRLLESQHRQIREGDFLAGLPTNRQALYKLLRDIEKSGGWPYIPSMSLRTLLSHLGESEQL